MRILGLPNTASITNSYDVMARLLNTTLQNSAGTVLDAYTYGYDVGYERTNVIRTGGDYVNYAYDGIGQLTNATAKEPGGVTTLYLVDTQNATGYPQVLEESTVASGVTNLSTTYTYGLALISQRSTATSFYGLDGHGNMRFLTGLTGSITDTYTYDAYGNLISSSGSTPNHYLYCAEQLDADLGKYYLRARYYQPATGRFWTMDTSEGDQEDPLSLHKYFYGEGDPVDNADPSGNDIGDLLAISDIDTTLDALPTGLPLAAIPIHRIRKVTVQSYIGAVVAWGFKGDNHGPTEHPSNHYRTTSTITFEEGNPSAPARVESKTGVTVKVATGEKGLASAKGLTGSMNRDDTGDINISMVGDAKNPLIFPQSATPPIHYDLRLSLIYRMKHYQGAIRHSFFRNFRSS